MTTELPTRAKLTAILNDLRRRPRTPETKEAIDRVTQQLRECTR